MQKTYCKRIYKGKQRYTLLVLVCFFCHFGMAQRNPVNGVVLDEQGEFIPGVSIIVKGTTSGTVTDGTGKYNISVENSAILVFSFIGFATQEINVGNRSKIDVTLAESLEVLEEVVLIGYGEQLRENISGSVSQVDVEALKGIPAVGIDQLLQGRASGLNVTQNSGQPGSSVSIRIRGVNSIQSSSEPLYIIDGVPVSGDSRNIAGSGRSIADNSPGGGGNGSNDVSPLSALNPNDIASVVVLKDASASAIYGSRGSNGVVLITTKKGENKTSKISYNSFASIQRPTNIIDVLDLQEYAKLQNTIGEIYGLPQKIEFLNPDLLGPGTNWQQEIFDDAFMQSHQLSFSGGNENINYFLSAGLLDQEGTVIGSGFDRVSVRANVNAQINDWVNVGMSLTGSRTNEQLTLNNSTNGLIGLSLLNNPATAVYNPDGSFAGPTTPDEIAFGFVNPIAEALNISNELARDRLLGNIFAEFNVMKKITIRAEVGGDFGNNKSDRFQPSFSYGAVERGVNQLNVRRENNDFWVIKNLITYNDSFNDVHDVTVLVGHEAQESSWQGVNAQDGDFIGNDLPILGTGNATDVNSQYKGSSSLESYLSRVIYTFDDKYNLTTSIRADGSSNFAKGNKWGYFPSVAVSWRLSEENFLSDLDFVQNVKLYGGYGEVGNQGISPFSYGSRLTPSSTDLGTGFLFANFGNSDLVWESSNQVNIGLDFSTFDSHLNATIEVYNKISKDFLFQFSGSNSVTGGNAPGAIGPVWVNLGEMQNKGIDITLNYDAVIADQVTWNSTLTFSHYKNNVKELRGNLNIFGELSFDDTNQNITFTRQGQPLGLFYGYQVEGLFRSLEDIEGAPIQFDRPFQDALFSTTWLGDIKYKDINGDNVIDGKDRTVIGNPHPDFTFGFQNSFSYKNFDLSVFMQGSYGNDVFNAIGRSLTAGNRTFTNQSPSVVDFWSVDNPDSGNPRLARNDTPNTNISDRYVEDGSYLRIQNVTLGYTLPSSISEKAYISRLKVYASIQNLHTFTKYSGYDPEVGSYNQRAILAGVDNGRYPTPRTYTLGVNVEF